MKPFIYYNSNYFNIMNNYHIYEEIGRGKYSVVYKGRKKKSIEYVAVKSVERGRRKKLMDEVAIFQLI
jgi:serine/threonine-protein kinase ULK4